MSQKKLKLALVLLAALAAHFHWLEVAGVQTAFIQAIAALAAVGMAAYQASQQGDDQYKGVDYRDIDLKNENPELYQELLKMRLQANEAEKMYNARRQGMTDLEQRELGQDRSHQEQVLANQGLLGTSVGNDMAADYDAKLRGSIAERALREQQALYSNMVSARQNEIGDFRQAQNDIVQAKTGKAQTNFAANRENQAAQNQFISGVVGGAANLYGNYQNQNQNQQLMDQLYARQGLAAYGYGQPIPYSGNSYNNSYNDPYAPQGGGYMHGLNSDRMYG